MMPWVSHCGIKVDDGGVWVCEFQRLLLAADKAKTATLNRDGLRLRLLRIRACRAVPMTMVSGGGVAGWQPCAERRRQLRQQKKWMTATK